MSSHAAEDHEVVTRQIAPDPSTALHDWRMLPSQGARSGPVHTWVVGLLPTQEVVGEGGEVLDMSEGVFAEALAGYPAQELAWLQALYEDHLRQGAPTAASLLPAVLLPALSGFRTKARACIMSACMHGLRSDPQPQRLHASPTLSGQAIRH